MSFTDIQFCHKYTLLQADWIPMEYALTPHWLQLDLEVEQVEQDC